jgi:hypothetical protein
MVGFFLASISLTFLYQVLIWYKLWTHYKSILINLVLVLVTQFINTFPEVQSKKKLNKEN